VLVVFGAEAGFQPDNFILDVKHSAFLRKHFPISPVMCDLIEAKPSRIS
jgi:hypothetical protein